MTQAQTTLAEAVEELKRRQIDYVLFFDGEFGAVFDVESGS